jgi:hypothetical protein
MMILLELADHPFQSGDFRESDESGRPLEVKEYGCWVVTYHADHAIKELRVIEIEDV